MKIKKDDTVMVIAGADKGKKGKVLRTYPKDDRVVVRRKHKNKAQETDTYSKSRDRAYRMSNSRFQRNVL